MKGNSFFLVSLIFIKVKLSGDQEMVTRRNKIQLTVKGHKATKTRHRNGKNKTTL